MRELESIDRDWLGDVLGGAGMFRLLGGAAAKEVGTWGARLANHTRFRPAAAAVMPPPGQRFGAPMVAPTEPWHPA